MTRTIPPGGLRTMPRTIQCPECGVVLNIPEAAAGRRLKCPKCGNKFAADVGPVRPSGPASSSMGPAPSSGDFAPVGASAVRRSPGASSAASSHGDLDLPTAAGSLRELFDAPSLGEDLPPARVPHAPSAFADPMALFKDDPPARRKATAAEGRSRARRCPTCGGVVPQGMSLCSTCGLDLETGSRISLAEELEVVPGPPRPTGPPIGVIIVGGLTISASVILSILALLKWQAGEPGYLFLLLVCGFGIYGAVNFLRLKSIKLLMVALTLGALVDVVAMIALPVYSASVQVDIKNSGPIAGDDDNPAITNISDHLDVSKLTWGIGMLVGYAGLSFYLNSPGLRRHFR